MKQLTLKQFNQLCKKHEPVYCADEFSKEGKHWSVWRFQGVSGEYKQLEKEDSNG